MSSYVYAKDQELASYALAWYDSTGTLLDFSSGYTFTVKIAASMAPTVILATKTTGITGAASSPNVLIDWSTTDFTGLTAGGSKYVMWVYARRTADSKDRVFAPDSLPSFTLLTAPA